MNDILNMESCLFMFIHLNEQIYVVMLTVFAFFLVYLDNNVNMFMDPQRSTAFTGPLYQAAADPTTYYLNEDMTIMINMVEAEDLNTIKG